MILDTFIVRPILVPAFVVLVYRYKGTIGLPVEPIIHDPAEIGTPSTS